MSFSESELQLFQFQLSPWSKHNLPVCGFSQILSWSIPRDWHAKGQLQDYFRRAWMMYMFSCLHPTILTFDIRNNMLWPTLTKYILHVVVNSPTYIIWTNVIMIPIPQRFSKKACQASPKYNYHIKLIIWFI